MKTPGIHISSTSQKTSAQKEPVTEGEWIVPDATVPALSEEMIEWMIGEAIEKHDVRYAEEVGGAIMKKFMKRYFPDVYGKIGDMIRSCQTETELCHFIHPAVTDDEEKAKIHHEIANLVSHYQAQDICSYLNVMAADQKILLPMSGDAALKELQRMGMPDEDTEGFSAKTFYRYYRK